MICAYGASGVKDSAHYLVALCAVANDHRVQFFSSITVWVQLFPVGPAPGKTSEHVKDAHGTKRVRCDRPGQGTEETCPETWKQKLMLNIEVGGSGKKQNIDEIKRAAVNSGQR